MKLKIIRPSYNLLCNRCSWKSGLYIRPEEKERETYDLIFNNDIWSANFT